MPTRVQLILPTGIFTAKIDGQQLKPQKMDAADLAAYQNKEMTVPQPDGTLLSDKTDAEGI